MKSYFKFLSRNKAYTFINIAGLVVSQMFIIVQNVRTLRLSPNHQSCQDQSRRKY